jgi:SAM-dependent methyltransferase
MSTRRTIRRSVRLLGAFRLEQSDPDHFYGLLADDAAELIGERVPLTGALVLDVGGGAGYLAKAFRERGAHCFVAEPDTTELSWRGPRPDGAVIGDGYALPIRTAAVDLVASSNVLEHVASPHEMLVELARVTRPGGHLWVSFTNWYSPWGGHEVSPWHYVGAERALARYRRRYGRTPKNVLGTNLFKVHVGKTLAFVRSSPLFEVLDVGPRYHPAFARRVVSVPALREVVTWNLELLLRRSTASI